MFGSTKYWSIGLVGLLLLLLTCTSCDNSSDKLDAIESTLEAVNSRIESDHTVVETAEAKMGALENQVGVNAERAEAAVGEAGAAATRAQEALAVAQTSEAAIGTPVSAAETSIAAAETAVVAAETAVAVAQTAAAPAQPTITPTPPAPGPMIPLGGGIDIAYQAADGYHMAFYPIEDWKAYRGYSRFEDDWPSDGPATVRLALVKGQDSEEWHLFYDEAEPIAGNGVTPTVWSGYTLLVELAGTEDGGTAGKLNFREGPEQIIGNSTPFTAGANTLDSLDALAEAGADIELDPSNSRLLLADDSVGRTKYTLVVFTPDAPAEDDEYLYWCMTYCDLIGWLWICDDYCDWLW